MSRSALLLALGSAILLSGCACPRGVGRSFDRERDSFTFSNELRWSYEFKESGEVITREADPAPEYSLRCFPMVRAAREFFYHVDFRKDLPNASIAEYRRLVRTVMGRNSRCPAKPEKRVVIPGYANLHEFSGEHADLLKEECGGAARSFFQRGNWRMVFPLRAGRREKIAEGFLEKLRAGQAPIAHVYQFPNTTLNHAVLIYEAEERPSSIVFFSYDPNDPSRAAILSFDRETRTFFFERNRYFGGGPARVYEVYQGLFF